MSRLLFPHLEDLACATCKSSSVVDTRISFTSMTLYIYLTLLVSMCMYKSIMHQFYFSVGIYT